ncbi:hypothetical protein K523DRAFT_248029, partial [Schizophyllum commune Tattone D]
ASTRRMKSSVPPSTARMQSCERSAANSTDLLSRKTKASHFSEMDLNIPLVDGDCDRYSSYLLNLGALVHCGPLRTRRRSMATSPSPQ